MLKYEQTYPMQAILRFNKKQYQKWIDTRWECIKKYHKGDDKEIKPCMKGEHFINNERYVL